MSGERTVDDFARGYLLAVANIMHTHGEDVIARDVLEQAGITKAAMERIGFDIFDLKPLRRLYADIASTRCIAKSLRTPSKAPDHG